MTKYNMAKYNVKKLVLLLALTLALAGCSDAEGMSASADMMEGVRAAAAVQGAEMDAEDAAAISDFAVRLLQQSIDADENTLISPVSVLYALGMTANGAGGETLAQMEAVLGLPVDELNGILLGYRARLAGDAEDAPKLSIANAIWFKDEPGLVVEPAFLQTNADYYGAGLYKAPFDAVTCDEINAWVGRHIDGMIGPVLDEISEQARLYLLNAVAFAAEWVQPYQEHQVHEGEFTRADGSAQPVELMHSTEGAYLEDGQATGFLKYYKGYDWAFAALLPNEGVALDEYVAGLSGQRLRELLDEPQDSLVHAAIPKFRVDHSLELTGALQAMGMEDAFDPGRADFAAMGRTAEGGLFIGTVQHDTHIEVNELGTRAGAVTMVAMEAGSSAEPEHKTVILDRPFVYLLVDMEEGVPLFIGVVRDVSAP